MRTNEAISKKNLIQSTLITELHVTKGAVSQVLGKLGKRGYPSRSRDIHEGKILRVPKALEPLNP